MVTRSILLSLSLVALGQSAASIPSDPLEMVTGTARTLKTPAARAPVLHLLAKARNSYGLRAAERAYDLKVRFQVNSGGQTKYDGAWQMEDVFDPREGFRWTATGPDSYSITRISSQGMLYGEGTGDYIPLRLHEARAALFDPLPSAQNVARDSIRTATGMYQGTQLTCVLLSRPAKGANAALGRRWDETEECIDPKSGLLRLHSQVPGRYYAYDYSDAPTLAGRTLPRKVTVTEGGKAVTEISVDSLNELPDADASLFVPTEEMKANGRPIGMGGAQKVWGAADGMPLPTGAAARTVCVFGVVTPSGELAEAHSLQPGDPDSQAAVAAAQKMTYSGVAPLGANPQQHFVFIFERFASSR